MLHFEDFKVGEEFDLGFSSPFTEESIINFAQQYDPQPFHIDPERAKDSFFGGLIASGWQTGSTYMSLLVKNMLNDTASYGSPGLDEIRWLKPVRAGDVLHGRFTVLETITSKSRPNVGIIKGKGELLNQHGETVMSLLSTGFFGRRPKVVEPTPGQTL